MNYHKVYMNHVHSSSLLSQLSTMWKSQTLCDAVIRTGSIITKAHRVVLVAACPMLQSMENATSGSHLEVRLASDIKQDSVNTFLQYLYEGFMMLTEENCKDVEKIARLLQVDNIIRCCADFNKCLNVSAGQQYKYSSLDQAEFRHMRTTDMLKVQEKSQKRFSESGRPSSPGSKRQRLHRPTSPTQDISMQGASHRIHDIDSMTEGYTTGANDPWDRVPKIGSGMQGASVKPGVIDIREDSLELIQTDPPKDTGGGRHQEQRKVQSSVGISVASQHNTSADLRIVNVTESQGVSRPSAAQQSGTVSGSRQITVSPLAQLDSPSSSSSVDSSKFSSDRFTSSQRKESDRPQPHASSVNMPTSHSSSDYTPMAQPSASPGRQKSQETFQTSTPQRQPYPVSLTAVRPSLSAQKPFAAGSATQAGISQPYVTSQGGMSQSFTEGMHTSPVSQRSQQITKPSNRSETIEIPPQPGQDSEEKSKPEETPSTSDLTPDISIVKVEASGTSATTAVDVDELNMYITEAVAVAEAAQKRDDIDADANNFEVEDPPGEWSQGDMSNEGNNLTGDQSGNWYMGSQFKDYPFPFLFRAPKEEAVDDQERARIKSSYDEKGSMFYHCHVCNEKFDLIEQLEVHYRMHHGQQPFMKVCRPCNKTFISRGGWRRHQQMYHSDRKFPECQICGKRCESPYNLKVHELSHTDYKGYHCPLCKKSYKLKHHLKAHNCPGRFPKPPPFQ